jgi:hypothetical protein
MKTDNEYLKEIELITEGPSDFEQMVNCFYRIVEQNQRLSQQKRALIMGMFMINLICDLAGIKQDGLIRRAFTREIFIRVGLQMIAQVRRTDPRNQQL